MLNGYVSQFSLAGTSGSQSFLQTVGITDTQGDGSDPLIMLDMGGGWQCLVEAWPEASH